MARSPRLLCLSLSLFAFCYTLAVLVCFCYSFLCLSSTFLLLESTFLGLSFARKSAIQVAIPEQFQAIPALFWQFWHFWGLARVVFLWVFGILAAIRATSRLPI